MSMFRRRLLMYQALMNKSDVINYPGLFYDQRKESNNIYTFGSGTGLIKEIAYNRANNTKQYINGILNTTIDIKDLLNKKQLIHNIEVLANEENS